MKRVSFYRIWAIVAMAVRFFVLTMWFQKRHQGNWTPETTERWERLLKQIAAEYKRTALRLEGLLIKMGQFLSTRADVMPQVFLDELSDLVDKVPPVPWEEAKTLLEAEWRCEHGEILQKISVHPVASASIGEVYHGYLHNGDSVAVKIQRPGIEKIIAADFKAIRIVTWLVSRFTSFGKKADLPALYREMVSVLGDELNFRQELQNGLYFRQRYQDDPGVYIPRYYEEHSTRRVLVMEWIEGAKVTDISYLEANGIDRSQLALRLFTCFAEQLFFEGKFHADPHPGNLLVRPDGTLVLIDFGMVGSIRKEDARYIRDLVEGIVLQDYGKIIDSLEKLRFLLPTADKAVLERVLAQAIQFYQDNDIKTMEYDVVQNVLEDMQRVVRDQPIQMPSEFAFLGRAVSIFVGVMHSIDPSVDLMEAGKPIVKEWLARNQQDNTSTVGRIAKDFFKPFLLVPRLIQQAADRPQRERDWQETQQQNEFLNGWYVSMRRYAFGVLLAAAAAGLAGAWLERWTFAYGGGAVAAVAGVCWWVSSARHLRFIKSVKKG